MLAPVSPRTRSADRRTGTLGGVVMAAAAFSATVCLAQPPQISGQDAAAAIGAAPQARVTRPPPAPTVKPGDGPAATAVAIKAAVAAGDVKRVMTLGGSAMDVANAYAAGNPALAVFITQDVTDAHFITGDDQIGVTLSLAAGAEGATVDGRPVTRLAEFFPPQLMGMKPPAEAISDPALAAAIGTPDVAAILGAGGTARDVAYSMQAHGQIAIPPEGIAPDVSKAQFVQFNGGVALGIPIAGGGNGRRLLIYTPEIKTYVPPGGVASLPTVAQALGGTEPIPKE